MWNQAPNAVEDNPIYENLEMQNLGNQQGKYL